MTAIQTLHEGAELVRRILDAVPGGVVHVARDGSIRSANPEALRILGLRFDEVSQRFIADFEPQTFHEDGTPCPAADYPVARVLATGKPQPPVTIGVRKPDGELSWAVFRAEPVLDADNTLAGAIVTFLDITARKRAEEDLRASEQKWRSLAQHLPDFVLVVDREARIHSINRVLPGYREDDVVGRHSHEFIDPALRPAWQAAFDETLATGNATPFETRGVSASGEYRWYETVFVPVSDDGVVRRVLVVARDVTERRAMLANLAEKERLASVGMLAASVAHEIMNPLTYVLANLDFAMSERGTEEARRGQALAEAREGAQRMQQIVWDLRALGRAGIEELFYVDARSVLELALRLSGPEVARKANVVLALDEVPGVLASESRLCQVLINLLVNAAQAVEHQPFEAREIRVRTRHDGSANLVGIEIQDTGVGIPPDLLPRIFEPFYTTKPMGTGLGLSISRDIVERMGGRIDATSTLGRGTTFTVWLSTKRAAAGSPERP
ncbi:MAG: PAS domain S-box protein [Labilithrix sp.]|nr:PAS domain S-box protein [Labilithrix sp.]